MFSPRRTASSARQRCARRGTLGQSPRKEESCPDDPVAADEVVILTEAGPSIGHGHLGRCVALYDAFEAEGARPKMVVRGTAERKPSLVEHRRVEFAEWLDGARLVAGTPIAVVDSYEAPESAYESIAAEVEVAVWLDDTARLAYPSGVVVNGGLLARSLPYARPVGASLLLGPRYQPLRCAFWQPPERRVSERVERVLVVFGGSDVRSLGPRLAALFADMPDAPSIHLVDGSLTGVEMRDAMLAADVAVSAAGQTLYELAAVGVPTVGVVVADNQRVNSIGWQRAGFLKVAGMWNDPGVLERAVELTHELDSVSARCHAAHAGQRMVDGAGASRVSRFVRATLEVARLTLRRVVASDAADLLQLANDPIVRNASFSTDRITPQEHASWLERRMHEDQTLLLVAEDDGGNVGQMRFDVAQHTATVSVSLAERARGRGLARPLLERSVGSLQGAHPEVRHLLACLRPENGPSRALFAGAGFVGTGDTLVSGQAALRFERTL